MATDRRSGPPVLAPPVSRSGMLQPTQPLARSVTPETPPPPPPPKEAAKKALPSKPKPVFPGPSAAGSDPAQSFAMSGPPPPRTEGPENAARAQRPAASDGIRDRQLPATPQAAKPSGVRGTALTPIDTRTAATESHARSREPPASRESSTRGSITPTRTSPTILQSGGFERSAVRTSSRPRAPRSSSAGPASATSMRSLDQAGPRIATALDGVPSPSYRPVFPSANVPASPTDAHPPLSYIDYTTVGGSSGLAGSSSPSPSPRDEPELPSVLDRPRPRTPAPQSADDAPLAQQRAPSRLLAPRPSAPAILPSFATAPVFPGRPVTARKSSLVLDRPHLATPDRSSEEHRQSPSRDAPSASGTSSRSITPTLSPVPVFPSKPRPNVLDRPRPRTPEPTRALAVEPSRTPHLDSTASGSAVAAPLTPGERPPQARLANSSLARRNTASSPASSQDTASPALGVPRTSVLDRPRPKTPDATSWLHGVNRAAALPSDSHRQPNDSATTLATTLSTSKYGSLDSIGPLSGSGISSATPASTISSHGASSESDAKLPADTGGSPLLKLDFDFGAGFGTTGTMFGLSDFLQGSGDLTPAEAIQPGGTDRVEPAASPSPAIAAATLSALPPRSSSLEGLATPRTGSREASAVSHAPADEQDLDPTAMTRPVAPGARTDTLPRRDSTRKSLDASTAETIPDDRSKSASIVSSLEASPDRPKRKRRKSLASLLSFRSTSQSVDDSHGLGGAANAAPVGSVSSLSSREAESEGPMRRGETGKKSAPAAASSRSGDLTSSRRKSQDLFHRGSQSRKTSPEDSRGSARSGGFQVISATTSRRPSRGASASISSVHTAETDSSDFHRPSLDFGRQSTGYRNGPDRPDSRHQRVPSVPLGRRLVGKFLRKDSNKAATAETPSESWAAPLKDHSSEDAGLRPRLGRRRGSFSSLLGFKSGDGGESASAAEPATKKVLGMSLMAGRRSEDLLTSGRVQRSAPEERPRVQQGRHSLDMFAERLPRKSGSSDDLLVSRSGLAPCFRVWN